MATEVPKAEADIAAIGPPGGCWWPVQKGDGTRSAVLCCPRCGKAGSLSGHQIAADGTVSPSVLCGYNCGFHESGVRLLGWES